MTTHGSAPTRRPVYMRVLRLRHVHVGGFVSFLLFECMIALGVLLALAELVNWWAVPVLPAIVAVMVKVNDLALAGTRERRAPDARQSAASGRDRTNGWAATVREAAAANDGAPARGAGASARVAGQVGDGRSAELPQRKHVGVIRISIPPRDGGVGALAARSDAGLSSATADRHDGVDMVDGADMAGVADLAASRGYEADRRSQPAAEQSHPAQSGFSAASQVGGGRHASGEYRHVDLYGTGRHSASGSYGAGSGYSAGAGYTTDTDHVGRSAVDGRFGQQPESQVDDAFGQADRIEYERHTNWASQSGSTHSGRSQAGRSHSSRTEDELTRHRGTTLNQGRFA